jgi:hypothetical protein
MPRYQILTTGMKVSKSPNAVRSNKFERAQDLRNLGTQCSTESIEIESPMEPKTQWDEEKVSKRKSRLNTTLHLAPKLEISPSDRNIIFREGNLRRLPKQQNNSLGYYIIKNGMLHEYPNDKDVLIV